MIMVLTVRNRAEQRSGTGRRHVMAEMTVSDSGRLRAALDKLITGKQCTCRSQAVAEQSEHDGEKLVDGQAVLDLQRAGQDDDRNRAGGMVHERVLARTGSDVKAMVAGERGCGRYAAERARLHGMDWC